MWSLRRQEADAVHSRPWLRSRRLSGLSGAFRPSLVRATRRQHHSGLYRDRLPTPQTYLTPPPHTAGCGRWFPCSVARGAPSGRGTPPWPYFRGTAPPPHPALQRPVDRWIRGGGTCLAHGELIRARREDEALLHHCWDLTSEPAGPSGKRPRSEIAREPIINRACPRGARLQSYGGPEPGSPVAGGGMAESGGPTTWISIAGRAVSPALPADARSGRS